MWLRTTNSLLGRMLWETASDKQNWHLAAVTANAHRCSQLHSSNSFHALAAPRVSILWQLLMLHLSFESWIRSPQQRNPTWSYFGSPPISKLVGFMQVREGNSKECTLSDRVCGGRTMRHSLLIWKRNSRVLQRLMRTLDLNDKFWLWVVNAPGECG